MSKRSKDSTFLWISVAVIVIGAIFLINSQTTPDSVVLPTETSETDHFLGNAEATVTLVEYGDFQCPACAAVHPVVDSVVSEFKNHIKFIYRHFPLTGHRFARHASRASEAAAIQGKFWEMQAKLYETQDEWKDSSEPEQLFATYAQELDLDIEKYEADYASEAVEEIVENAFQSAIAAKLGGTPAFFLNGEQISVRSAPGLREQIRTALDNAQE